MITALIYTQLLTNTLVINGTCPTRQNRELKGSLVLKPVLYLGFSSLRESLVILTACLIRSLHLEQVDSLVNQQLFGVAHRFWGQEARAAEDPGIVYVEQAEDVGARIHNGEAGVVGGQNPVGAVGSNWEMKEK